MGCGVTTLWEPPARLWVDFGVFGRPGDLGGRHAGVVLKGSRLGSLATVNKAALPWMALTECRIRAANGGFAVNQRRAFSTMREKLPCPESVASK
jgi:hypothetical protein